jgi:hypothetical protein
MGSSESSFPSSLSELPGGNLFDRLVLRLFEDPLLFQKVADAGIDMFLAHRINSLRANAKSSSGAARVFLMKPCNATGCSR